MKIIIEYSSIWQNSFLDGSNNDPIFINDGKKDKRKYIASAKGLKSQKNHLKRNISHDTVMGVLNRLIGDRQKLHQARNKSFYNFYYFEEIEKKVSFIDSPLCINDESIYLRNKNKSDDPSGYIGALNDSHALFSSDFSNKLFSVLFLTSDELVDFILNDNLIERKIDLSVLNISNRLNEISLFKDVQINEEYLMSVSRLNTILDKSKIEPKLIKKNKKDEEFLSLSVLYFCAIEVMISRLLNNSDYDKEKILKSLSKSSKGIPGLSRNGFTKKDFFASFSKGKKIQYGNPYIASYFANELNEYGKKTKVHEKLKTKTGILEINLEIPREKSIELKKMIENANVGSFFLGKKGLAYVKNIKL